VDFLVKTLPVEDVGHPCQRIGSIEEGQGDLPGPEEGVDEEDVPGHRHEAIVQTVRILHVDSRMLDVIARVDEKLTFTVELNGLARLVDAIRALEVLLSTLGELSLRSVDDLVQVVDLTELSLGEVAEDGTLAGSHEHRSSSGILRAEHLVCSHYKVL